MHIYRVCPETYLLNDIPEDPAESWYSGLIKVILADAVTEKSDPFTHAAQLMVIYRQLEAASVRDALEQRRIDLDAAALAVHWLSLETDGGADRNNKHLKVRSVNHD